MSFQSYTRNPSGVVFFGADGSETLYTSASTFTYDDGLNALKIPNGGYIGSQGDYDAISIASNGNISLTQSLSIAGNLTVNGTTTTVNTTNLDVKDSLVMISSGTATPANDAGILIDRGSSTNAFMGWDESADKFIVGTTTADSNSTGDLSITAGTLVANIEGDITGNAGTATALETARNFSLTGQVTAGNVSFDGQGNVALSTSLAASAITSQSLVTEAPDSAQIIMVSGSSLQRITKSNFVSDLGAMSSFTIKDNVGGTQTIADGDQLVFTSGDSILVAVSATDTMTVSIPDGEIRTAKLATGAVTTAKVADSQITFAKMAPAAIILSSEGITSNDNDTTLPTSAAVRDLIDSSGNLALASAKAASLPVASGAKIQLNTSNISTNTSNISTNTSNISTNTSNISTNASNITSNTNLIHASGNANKDYTASVSGWANIHHKSVSAASSVNNTGRTYIQDITLDSFGHITAIASATETVTDTTYSAGDGLDLTSTTFSVDLKANGGLAIESTELAVNLGASNITGTLAISDGGTGATTDSAARTALGLAIGTDVQAYDAQLADIAGLTPSDGGFIVGNGSNFVVESTTTARASLGLGSLATLSSVDTAQLAAGAVTEAKRERTVHSLSTNGGADKDITLVTTSSTNKTVYLPGSPSTGQIVMIKKIDSGAGAVIVNASGSTIDDASTKNLYGQYESLSAVYNGSEWFVV